MAMALSNRALYIYSGGMARELSITGLSTEPLAILEYPWNPGRMMQVMESFLHYRETCDVATESQTHGAKAQVELMVDKRMKIL